MDLFKKIKLEYDKQIDSFDHRKLEKLIERMKLIPEVHTGINPNSNRKQINNQERVNNWIQIIK